MKIKNSLKVLLLVATVFTGAVSASAEGRVTILPYAKTSYALIAAEALPTEAYSVAIVNSIGEVVYSSNRNVAGSVFTRVFDFSNLEDGKYKVRLRSKKGLLHEEAFSVKKGSLTKGSSMAAASESVVKIWSNDDFLYVSHLNHELNGLFIRLEDARGSVLYNSSLPSDLTYTGKFNVSALPKGDYKVSFVSGNKVFNYDLRK